MKFFGVWFSLQKWILIFGALCSVASANDLTTDNTFLPGPNGELCILDDRHIHDPTYQHSDERGMKCCCSLCRPGKYVQGVCQCEKGMLLLETDTKCVPVETGKQYIGTHNKCSQPYNCSLRCHAHQHEVMECTSEADLRCECDEGWYNPDPADTGSIPQVCRPKPSCPAGEEPRRSEHAGLFKFKCKPCHRGYFKAEGGNWKSCKPHRNCQIQQGSNTADNVCLNDDVGASQTPTQESRLEEQSTTKLGALLTTSPEMKHQEQRSSTEKPVHSETDTEMKRSKADYHQVSKGGVAVSFVACGIIVGLLGLWHCYIKPNNRIAPA